MKSIYLLFEGDLGGLGSPEGFSEELEDVFLFSLRHHDCVAWFSSDNQFIDLQSAQEYFDNQEQEDENCLWLYGEIGQECVIFRIFPVKT